MSNHQAQQPGDAALGMHTAITRRDFLGSTLLASGALLMESLTPAELLAAPDDFTGYGGVGEYRTSNGNTLPVLGAGHTIRDKKYEPLPADTIDTGEMYDCVIVGGGISGLAAALFFQRQVGSGPTCLILENHPIFGGEAKTKRIFGGQSQADRSSGFRDLSTAVSAQLSCAILRFHWIVRS